MSSLGRVLCIGCVPRKVEVTYFDDWIEPFIASVLKANHAKHYMLPPLDYGKGKAEVNVAVRVWLAVPGNKVPKVLHVDRRHPLADSVLTELIPHYDEIFEKV